MQNNRIPELTESPEPYHQNSRGLQAAAPDASLGQFVVFISYSRKDERFVRSLEERLEASERRTWIDHGEVMPTEDWRMAIYSGIEAADNFVFVISPHSLDSKVCADELAHAIAHNKKVVPILYHEVESHALPADLARLNWIPFREEDEFDRDFETLCAALDTDLEYVRRHTRLLTRALEWENKGRDKSLTLRGSDLQEAEQWLIQASTKTTSQPTEQQTVYIIASRKAETKRQRVLLGAVLLGLIVAVTLAIISLISRNTAITQRQIADERRRVALSRQLAAQSLNLLPGQIDLAMLLAAEANRAANTVEAQACLLGTLAYAPDVGAFLPCPMGDVENVAFSPDGRMLASGNGPNVRLWDVGTQQAAGPALTGHTDTVTTLAFSPDGRILASGSRDHSIILWDVSKRQKLGHALAEHTAFVQTVVFSQDGKLIVSGGSDGKIILWDVATQKAVDQLTGHGTNTVFELAFSPDGKLLASGSFDQTVILWDVATRQPRDRFLTNSPVWSLAFSHDGKTLATTSKDSEIILWDLTTRRRRQSLGGNEGGVWSIAFSGDNKLLASAGNNGEASMWDLETGQRISHLLTASANPLKCVALSPDGKMLAWGGYNAQLGLWDISSRGHLGLAPSSWAVAYSTDGNVLATGNEKDLYLWDLRKHELVRPPLKGHAHLSNLVFSPNGKWLATYGNAYAEMWDVSVPQDVDPPLIELPGMSVDFSPDGQTLAVGDFEGTIAIIDLTTMKRSGEYLNGHDGPVPVLAYSRDGRTLASVGRDATVRLWDVATHRQRGQSLTGHDGAIWGMAISHDGATLASGSIDDTIRLWDVATGRQLAVLVGQPHLSDHLAFSPDGRILASCSSDSMCFLWDVSSRQLLVKLRTGQNSRSHSTVAFSPDGKTLTTGNDDVILWDVSPESWKARVCKVANRNLTSGEWAKYLGDEPRRKTCPDLPLPP